MTRSRILIAFVILGVASCPAGAFAADPFGPDAATAPHPPQTRGWPTPAVGLGDALADAARSGKRWVTVTVASPAVGRNAEGREGKVALGLALPPGDRCRSAVSRCPWVVFLPGFGTAPHIYGPENNPVMRAVDASILGGRLPAVRVIVVDGRTRLGGGYYVDSPTTGGWTTFLGDELLPALESYSIGAPRVVVAGHSMGGYGALHASLTYAGRFAGVVAISPVLRSSMLQDRLMPVIVKRAGGVRPTYEASRAPGVKTSFSEKLLWATLAAWCPAPDRAGGVPDPFSDSPPLTLRPEVVATAAAFDLPRRVQGHQAGAARKLPRVALALGARDGLTPFDHARDLVRAWRKATKRPRDLQLRLHGGDHATRMADDLVRGLQFVLAGRRR